MEVFVLVSGWDYGTTEVDGVFTNLESAQSRASDDNKGELDWTTSNNGWRAEGKILNKDFYFIEKMEVQN